MDNQMLVNQLVALVFLFATLVVMEWGFAIMLQAFIPNAGARYLRWVQRTFISRPFSWAGRMLSRQAGRLVTWLLNQAQAFLTWFLRQLWRMARHGAVALYRGVASLL